MRNSTTFFRVFDKFQKILSRHQKIRIVELAILMIIGGFMEMLSVSIMVPFMNIIMDPKTTMNGKNVQFICRLLRIESDRTFLVFVALILACIYIVKNVYLLFQNYVQNRFVYGNMLATEKKLLHAYLSRPYEYFLDIKSSEVIRVIQSDTAQAFTLLTQMLQIISEVIVSVTLITTVFVISPHLTVGMAIILLASMIIIVQVIRPKLTEAGVVAIITNGAMIGWLMQAIQGIKEVKIQRKEKYFENEFDKNGTQYISSLRTNNLLGMVPRFMIEATFMSSFFIIVAIMIYNGASFQKLIPVLSAVAMAAIRLLPSVNRISSSLSAINYGEPSLDKLLENLSEASKANISTVQNIENKKNENDVKVPILNQDISLTDITYKYPQGNIYVLDKASMTILKGDSVGIVGASGAGKTTAVDILLGLLNPLKGVVTIDGVNIRKDMGGWLAQIGYIPQDIYMLDADIRSNVAFGVDESDISDTQVWKVLEDAAIAEFVKSLPDGLNTNLGEKGVRLSGGQRQRIGIARALYGNPSVLIFDEATSALDNETESEIMDSINRLHGSKTMIIIAHRLSTIENCDKVFKVENGQIVRDNI